MKEGVGDGDWLEVKIEPSINQASNQTAKKVKLCVCVFVLLLAQFSMNPHSGNYVWIWVAEHQLINSVRPIITKRLINFMIQHDNCT
jgi:hypothetical protein